MFFRVLKRKGIIGKRIQRKFFTRPTLEVAKDILGKYLIRKINGKFLIGKIVETEAYIGPKDKASHAYLGKRTIRNEAEYLIGGHIYIYLVYGMYWQLNISTNKENKPECILIRALEPIVNRKSAKICNLANGPGKLCRWLKLDKSFYAEDLTKSGRIWLEDSGEKIDEKEIKAAPRIGIDYAGYYWAKKNLRFYLKSNPCVSRKI